MDCKEPYRATKLWNDVIKAFQSGMPLKKHRRNIHVYHDSFSASEAVTWLHCYLLNNSNFGPDVTRQQTINLLGKFLKCRVIECITVKSKKLQFCDNSHLYRFTQISPQQFKTLPLRLMQSPSQSNKETEKSTKAKQKYLPEFQKENIPECLFVEKKISLTELGLLWKTATVSRLEHLVSDLDLSEILDEKSISGHVIKHNVCRISKTGVVTLIDKTDDIPPWVISAMKCLANWPNASGSGSCLPNYPGFEKDVFKVVRDFFINSQVPLLPAYLSSAMISVFTHFLHDQIKHIYKDKNFIKKDERSSNLFSPPSSTSIKTSTPALNGDRNKFPSKNGSLLEKSDGILLLDNPDVMWDYPSMIYFETDFGTSDPVTKVVPSQSDLYLNCDYLRGSMESISTISVCSMNQATNSSNNNCLIPTSPLKNWRSDSCLRENKKTISTSQSLQRNMSVEHCNRQSQSMFDLLFIDDSGSDEKLNTSVCSSKTLTEEDDKVSLCNFENKSDDVSAISNQNLASAKCNKSSPLHQCSHVSENSTVRNNLNHFKEMIYPSELKLSFQLFLLFLSPPNRRQLHLLFRVINKILKNQKFILDVEMPMQDYLLQTFLPAIVQSDVNQNIILGMVSFMLDNCEAVFQPPSGLKEEVEELSKSRNGRIVYSVDDTCFLTYCEMVSKQQYEEQKVSTSTEALKDLLHSIIVDQKLTEKERKRRIKQFKENHPDIYYELFPGKHSHLVKSKSTFLNRFTSLRM